MTQSSGPRGPRYTDLAASLPASVPFVGPETQERERGRPFRARLGANESLFGPSPHAVTAMAETAQETWKYGDAQSWDLRVALAERLGVGMDNIMVGEGIDGLLGYLVRLVVGPGDRVVTSLGAYPTFNYHVAGFGGELVTVPYRDDHEDPVALLDKARDVGAKLVYLANPDNPMGTWHEAEVIQRMIEAIPEGTLLVLDEAYLEFAPEGVAPALDVTDPRVIRMRTFSKAYGLAGARVGYAIGTADLISAFNKVRNHFGMARISQAGALAALQDEDYLAEVQAKVAVARGRIAEIAAENGLSSLPSATNFVAIDCGADGDFARRVLGELIKRDVFVRMPFAPPQDRCIRVSVGHPEDLDVFASALPEAVAAARDG
ncbi:pyridoxal phosphate-dependent aminotransferase [Maritimibacter sp. DP1N21-5]|uniref:pyridoxal phosphate-dependent aminotransferase n=1 Tax=Maritimibacter sp. DP1N21-5 TaxID=2836867 RepID=UPI001C44D8B7|nr:pyridoxal phosphate-dependent aminotransferase [Maritimibacter sp. DP1N21-5]MBV7410574.1 pyridoxal phosphate-dependent aminotransferase [Maritimibacter sp. DP1N21-5]